MVIDITGKHFKAYRSKREYFREYSKVSGKELLYESQHNIIEFTVSGYTYEDRKRSAYTQCTTLLKALKECYYDNASMFIVVGWIQAKASQFGLITRLRKEGYYD